MVGGHVLTMQQPVSRR